MPFNAVPFARSILPEGATVVNKTNALQMASDAAKLKMLFNSV